MKKLVGLVGLLSLVSAVAANVSEPWRYPYLPQIRQQSSYNYEPIVIDPIELPNADVPEEPMDRPVGGPNDQPRSDRPGWVLDEPRPGFGPQDLPSIMPVEPMDPKDPGVGGSMAEYSKGPGFWLPQPFFRNRLVINYSPYGGRMPGQVKVYDMGGRMVVRAAAQVANDRIVVENARLASLAPGSYIIEVECVHGSPFFGKVQKVD